MNGRVAVIGGGIGGASTALALARAGLQVTVIERGERLGGLVGSFEVGGTPLERFYHHIFPQEGHIQRLIGELGLAPRLEWFPSTVGIYTGGRIWPFTTPGDLLRFAPLPIADRIRAGVGALRLGRVADWQALDAVPALDWLARYTGRRVAEVVWDPLLAAKFGPAAAEVPAAWMWGRLQQRAGARAARGGERLGYLRGGFVQLFDAIERALRAAGVEVLTGAAVTALEVDGGRGLTALELDGAEVMDAGSAIFCGPLPALARLVPPDHRDPRWSATAGLGVLCVILEMRAPISGTYWTNVCDPALPFGGLIEHTNLIPAADYGCHVAYLSRYFTHDEPIAGADPDQEAERWISALDDRFAGFSRSDVLAVHRFRADYAAPLVRVGHAARIPPLRSHIPGLYVATTAQIYPHDRGMSEGVRLGTEAAAALLADRAPSALPS